MFQTKFVENIKTHFMSKNYPPPPENRAVHEMWKNTVEPGRPQMTIQRMRTACWIPRSTNTHSEYVMLIDFPLQQWLHERASVLRYTYSVCLVCLLLYFSFVRKVLHKPHGQEFGSLACNVN